MAKYRLLSEDESHKTYLMESEGFLESLKIAWYVIRYPRLMPILVTVRKKWADGHLKIADVDHEINA